MFSAIMRLFRSIGYLLTGQFDKIGKGMASNPTVIGANFDRIVAEKKSRINQYTEAISAMVVQESTKKDKIKELTSEIEKLEKLKAGAAAQAKKVAAKYGGDPEKTKADPDYVKHQKAFGDFSSTLTEKHARANELTSDVETLEKTIGNHKANIQSLLRELEGLKTEKHDTVADVISASEEKKIADMLNGLSEDRTSDELVRMRELRQQAKAGAKVSREIGGLDAKRAESEYLAEVEGAATNDEFDALMNFKSDEAPAAEKTADTSTPEA